MVLWPRLSVQVPCSPLRSGLPGSLHSGFYGRIERAGAGHRPCSPFRSVFKVHCVLVYGCVEYASAGHRSCPSLLIVS